MNFLLHPEADEELAGAVRYYLLTESNLFPLGPDGLTQQTAVLLTGWHDRLRKHDPQNVAMSLARLILKDFACIHLDVTPSLHKKSSVTS